MTDHRAVLVGGPHNGVTLTISDAGLRNGLTVAEGTMSSAEALASLTPEQAAALPTVRYRWDGTRDEDGCAQMVREHGDTPET